MELRKAINRLSKEKRDRLKSRQQAMLATEPPERSASRAVEPSPEPAGAPGNPPLTGANCINPDCKSACDRPAAVTVDFGYLCTELVT